MNPRVMTSFTVEMTLIKEAQVLRNIGTGILNLGKKVGAGIKAVPYNTAATLGAFGNPTASLKAGYREATSGKTGLGRSANKAMLFGGGAMELPDAMSKEDKSGQGRSKVQRMSAWSGNQIGNVMGMPYGTFTGPIVGSVVGSTMGNMAGKAVDKVRGYKPKTGKQ